jgi:hypothetical protein
MQVVSEPQAFLSNQQPPPGLGWPLEIVTSQNRSISRVLVFTKCAREVAKPLPSGAGRILRGAEDARRIYRLSVGADFGFWHFSDMAFVLDDVR